MLRGTFAMQTAFAQIEARSGSSWHESAPPQDAESDDKSLFRLYRSVPFELWCDTNELPVAVMSLCSKWHITAHGR